MIVQTLLNFVSLCLLICLIFFLTQRLASLKYGVYRCLVGAYIYGDCRCRIWLKSNRLYVWYFVLDAALIIVFLGLNSQFAKDAIQLKPLVSFLASPLIWLSILLILNIHEKDREKRIETR